MDAVGHGRRSQAHMMAPSSVELAPAASKAPSAPTQQRWCIITCEYPPLVGGVSDHTFLLATELAREGDEVEVWAPPGPGAPPDDPRITVHVLPSLFGFDALRLLRRRLKTLPEGTRVLVQYVPTGFGMRMMNVPFAFLLSLQRRRGIDVYFHEVGFPISRHERLRRNVAGVVHLLMAWLVTRAARRIYVAIPAWQTRLRRIGISARDPDRLVTWVPVPSNVPDLVDPARVAAARERLVGTTSHLIVGHFGTFGRFHQRVLRPTLERVLDASADRVVLLVGRGGGTLRDAIIASRPDLADRVTATGGLEPAEVSAHVAACDLLVQPYDDGVSARRGSLMAGLALGRPIVTNAGEATDALWEHLEPVLLTRSDAPEELSAAVDRLSGNAELRARLGRTARSVHHELFAMSRGVARLRSVATMAAPVQHATLTAPATSTTDHASKDAPILLSSATLAEEAPARIGPRVLMLHTTLPERGRKLGGVEIAVHRLANALVDLGVPVTVASLTSRPEEARYAHRRLFAHAEWLRDSRLGRLLVLPVLLNGLRLGDADVVHFHGDDWFVVWRPRASVRTLHGSALREAQGATRWQRRLIQLLIYPLERMSARLATITVAVGEDAAHLHDIRRVIGNGVDPELFHPGEKSAVPLVLYVGTWEGRKRGRWLYERFVEEIVPRHPTAVLRFIADVAPPAHPRVQFEEFPTDADLARAYRASWVFALPSTYEGFGIPYLEAMASGTAVVSTPNPGAVELLGNGRFGVLAADTSFVDAVLRLLDDDGARHRIESAALERSAEFTWRAIAEGYLRVYEEAIAARTGRRMAAARHSGAVRELVADGPGIFRERRGVHRGLALPAREDAPRWPAAQLGEWRIARTMLRLSRTAKAVVDIGAGDGAATMHALSRAETVRALAFEPDLTKRDGIRRALAPNGLATDPRLMLSGRAVGAAQDDETTTLDALLPEIRWPLFVRVAQPEWTAAVIDGGPTVLAQDDARWLVAVEASDEEAIAARFKDAGYEVRALRAGLGRSAARWLAAWRAADALTPT